MFFSGCKPAAYFNTPNDVLKEKATVWLDGGVVKEGEITIQFETNYEPRPFIHFVQDGKEERIKVDSILSYRIKDDYFILKKIDLDLNGTERLLFVKRLTKENSRIQLYELFQQKSHTSDGIDHYYYFISLPGQSKFESWSLGSTTLVPNFEEKMSRIVKDCQELADKIREKRKGYFLAQYARSDYKKVEVMQRIIEEYNNCH